MIRMHPPFVLVAVLVLLVGAFPGPSDASDAPVGTDPSAVCPILVGSPLPELTVRDADGESVDLNTMIADTPTVLIFYRGGWCPYCNTHLGGIQAIEPKLVDLGYRVLAISPDRPGKLKEAAAEHGFRYTLLSDSPMDASRALGIAFQVEDDLVSLYKREYGIDLEADSGQTHHQLPVPSAFVVDREGRIRFTYVNPNYKVRVDPEVLLAAARAAVESDGTEQ